MSSKTLFRQIKAANLKYRMVQTGDRIAGTFRRQRQSGSAARSTIIKGLYPLEFELFPVTIDLGWGDDWSLISEHCAALGLPHSIVKTQIGPGFEERKESNPVLFCSNLRSGSLNRTAVQLGCNKVALGHHLDDALVTLIMSMMFEGRYRTFRPVTHLSRMNLFLI